MYIVYLSNQRAAEGAEKGFDSPVKHDYNNIFNYAPMAQRIARLATDEKDGGSNPSRRTKHLEPKS
jgi:hypothetical protein